MASAVHPLTSDESATTHQFDRPTPLGECTDLFIPSVLRPYFDLPVQQVSILALSSRIKRQYQIEVQVRDAMEARIANCADIPVFAIRNDQKTAEDSCDYRIIDGDKRWRVAINAYAQRECHCKPVTMAVRVLDLTVLEAEKLMDKADQEENVFKVFGLSALGKSEDPNLDELDQYAHHFAERRVHGRIGRYRAKYLDTLLGDSQTDWSQEELYNAEQVWDVIKGVQWWLEAIYLAFSTEAAMCHLDIKNGEIHPLQKALLAESREVFELSTPACEEQIRSGYILCREDTSLHYDYDWDFPNTVALMRAYRSFTSHASDAICTIFPKVDRQKMSLIV